MSELMTAVQMQEQNPSVLLVDDSPHMLDVLCEMLAEKGYEITRALGGEAAIEALSTCRFDLIITDLHMGRVSGIDVLKRAKALCPETAVIIVTGNTSATHVIEALRYNVDGYLLKPFTMLDLLESISHCFNKRYLAAGAGGA